MIWTLDRHEEMRHAASVVGESRSRLSRMIEERRLELELSQEALAVAAGVSLSSVGRLERDRPVSKRIERQVERALQWEKGSIAAIRNDGEPSVIERPSASQTTDEVQEPDPADYPDEMEYLNAVYWYLRRGRNMSHEAVMRGFNMASAIYARKQSETASRRGGKPTEYPESRDGLIG